MYYIETTMVDESQETQVLHHGTCSLSNDEDDMMICEEVICEKNSDVSREVEKLAAIKLPPKMRKRGRPKGAEMTVVGLPRCKKLKSGPVAFENLIPEAKEKIMLAWFIGDATALDVLKGKLVTEDMVEVIPENVNNACISESVCLASIKRYFTSDAWKVVLDVVQQKKVKCVYYCPVCKQEIDDSKHHSINCNLCLSWLHLRCSGLKKAPKKRLWFCQSCKKF